MGISLDGLASGLDTTTLINSLMQAEAIPQNILKNKVSSAQTMVSALQALNTRVAALSELAKTSAKPETLQVYSATSSSTAAAATARAGATAGSLEVLVGQTAQAQTTVSAPLAAWPETSFTITAADGTQTAVAANSTSIDDVVSAVNASDAGVKAVKVAAGEGQYRIQFTAADSGADGAFTLSGTTAGLTEVKAARDAEVTLWAGTAAAQTVTSSTNTFTDLLPGLDVTVSAAGPEPLTVSVVRDTEAAGKVAENLVSSLNGLFGFIATNSASSAGSGGATKGMVFNGDSTVRDVNRKIMGAATAPVDGRSPSEIGISVTRDGTVEYDAEKFQAALAADPARVEATLQAIASRVATAAGEVSDKYDGQITSRITGQKSLISSMDDQVLAWDRRLDARRSTLERTYSALEVQLSSLNSQSSWLTSQLSALPNASNQK
ncbi:flagellar filament capping protein FliD [Arthrobacter halodurans]|uniref:Flagellar hook-associated protein 2 n=1 Tax=Arthrobacter halodurans TaxID=516699 RepID=A0ABV4UT53_9MICC